MKNKTFIPSKEKDFVILFSESVVGIHMKTSNDTEEYEVISLVFPPTVEKTSGGVLKFKNNLIKNSDFLHGVSLYKEGKGKCRHISIAIGYDDDDTGHFMSESLRENLINSGISEEDIFRTPLTEAGYILVQDFSDTTELKKFLYIQQNFRSVARSNGIRKNVGFSKIISLKYINKAKDKSLHIEENGDTIDPSGTSTATVVTQFMTGEI